MADDQPIVREGIVRMLERGGFEVVGAASDAHELVQLTNALIPDVVVTDIQMPPDLSDDGVRAALTLRAAHPRLGVILLSQFLDGRYAAELLAERAQGVGYLLKEKVANAELLADAIGRVSTGGTSLDPDVIAALVGRHRVGSPLETLTPREKDVLSLMAEGHSNAGIAALLFVTVAAVERHVTGIFTKLNLQQSSSTQHRRVLAVLQFLQA